MRTRMPNDERKPNLEIQPRHKLAAMIADLAFGLRVFVRYSSFGLRHSSDSPRVGSCFPPLSLRNTTFTPPSFGLLKLSSRLGVCCAGVGAAALASASGSSAERSAPCTNSAQ